MKIIKVSPEHRDALQQFGTEWTLTPELFKGLQAFTCHLYDDRASTNDVNDLHLRTFHAKKGKADSQQLSPCAVCLQKHCQCANYQTGMWKHSLESYPDIPSPVRNGWCRDNGGEHEHFVIDWLDVPAVPDTVLQLLACQCSRICKMSPCTCLANGLQLTEICKLTTYTSQVQNEEVCMEETDFEDDIVEEWN